MSEFEFTKGPWVKSGVRKTSPAIHGHAVGPYSGDWVVCVPYNDQDHAECLANARLIAAAPEMVPFVEKLAAWADAAERNPSFADDFPVYATRAVSGDVVWTLGELKQARALLSKIKGETASA